MDNIDNIKKGFFSKVFKPNIRVRVMSDSELNHPDLYSKKTINKYDGFSRIYFNGNVNKKKATNLVNSRFFYASGMLKRNKIYDSMRNTINSGRGSKSIKCIRNVRNNK